MNQQLCVASAETSCPCVTVDADLKGRSSASGTGPAGSGEGGSADGWQVTSVGRGSVVDENGAAYKVGGGARFTSAAPSLGSSTDAANFVNPAGSGIPVRTPRRLGPYNTPTTHACQRFSPPLK